MLEMDNIRVHYGSFCALRDVSLHVARGELVVLLGANGAGKSTIFRTISGLQKLSNGTIAFKGVKISNKKPETIVKQGIVHCPEGRHLFSHLSVKKNLVMGGYIHRKKKSYIQQKIEEVFELFPILKEKSSLPAGSLSGGQQQMLAIGRALMGNPKLLLLDEPSLGLAPLVVGQMFQVIQKINKSGTMILLAEQNAAAALQIADRGYVIESGSIVAEGNARKLYENDSIRRAYIGA